MNQPGKWRARCSRAIDDPLGFLSRVIKRVVSWVQFKLLNVFCDILFRWGSKLGLSGNFRGKMFWKAGRREIVPVSELYDYLTQERPNGHYYPGAPKWSSRSQSILNMLGSLVNQDYSFLEIGCNLGRNLNHLWQAGYRNVRGMEISEHAVKRLRSEYLCLADVPVDIGPAEQSIQKLGSRSVDVIFTMAVLENIHPDSRLLFKEIARVASKYVLAIEPRDGHFSHNQYPWDIESEYAAVGLSLVDTKPWSAIWAGELTFENEWREDMYDYTAFLFKVNSAGT